jgi:hypothetical protein
MFDFPSLMKPSRVVNVMNINSPSSCSPLTKKKYWFFAQANATDTNPDNPFANVLPLSSIPEKLPVSSLGLME